MGSSAFLVAIKVAASVQTSSVGILSEALDSLVDMSASLIVAYSIAKASSPPDADHRYGHSRYEHLAGTVEAILIFFAAFLIITEAISRILDPVPVESIELGILVMAISGGLNLLVARSLLKVARSEGSMALEADALRLRADFLVSATVILALLAIEWTGFYPLDPLIAIGISLVIVRSAWTLLRRTTGGLLDVKIPAEEEMVIKNVLLEHAPFFVSFHRLRTRLSGDVRYVDLHLQVKGEMTVEDAHRLVDHLEKEIESRLPRTHVLIHMEPSAVEREVG